MRRGGVALGLALVAACVVAGPADARYAGRPDPVVVAGSALPKLGGTEPGDLVAFRYRVPKRGKGRWKQVPVQLDERLLVDFGNPPGNNSSPGVDGTVYGNGSSGVTALQYADPNTFVGADPVVGLDGDDEVALVASDAGDKASKRTRRPDSSVRGRTRVKITDPLGGQTGFVYLFRSSGGLDPAAGRDYVRYDFRLASGDYKSTYRRASGPNPETSTISTASYVIGFSDRWFYDSLAITAGAATGVDILDGFKFQFGPGTCGRSEATFNAGEGAFVANIDGPVRAIRSYVGANSGPLTERTHIFWPDRHLIVTDLRVHPIGSTLIFHDLSEAGLGMTYSDSTNPAGVPVDGVQDSISPQQPAWRLWTGAQGSLISIDRAEGTLADSAMGASSNWYVDQANVPSSVEATCWGDPHAYGQAGSHSAFAPPNTDPRLGPAETLRSIAIDAIAGPGVDAAGAASIAARLDAPLTTTIH